MSSLGATPTRRLSSFPSLKRMMVGIPCMLYCARMLVCDFFENRAHHPARTAPWRPEVDGDGQRFIQDFHPEFSLTYTDCAIGYHKRGAAFSTAGHVHNLIEQHPVFGTALSALDYRAVVHHTLLIKFYTMYQILPVTESLIRQDRCNS
jgi:hypothetical protein